MAKTITITVSIQAHPAKVWQHWNSPEHIRQWLFASDDWECPKAEHELKEGGRICFTMRAKDGSAGFDFTGQYTKVEPNHLIEYIIDDGRKVQVTFTDQGDTTQVIETFEMENTHSEEQQRSGWQAILNNFKKEVESSL